MREGKLAMKVAEKEMGLRKEIKEVARPSSPLQVADKAVRSVREMTKLFTEEEEKKESD